jgi:RNA polymerase sigma-70 factor (ECF subfamily)
MNEVINVPAPTTGPSEEEFMVFMRAHQDRVFSTAARLVGREPEAEDIAQETFLRAHGHFAQLRSNPAAGGWLKTVATNLALNHLTRHRRRWRLFSDFASREDADDEAGAPPIALSAEWPSADSPPDELDAQQRRDLIDRALDRLPDHQRVPLVLHHFEEMSYQDIAVTLGISLAKVKSDIHRGRMALLKSLQAEGFVA